MLEPTEHQPPNPDEDSEQRGRCEGLPLRAQTTDSSPQQQRAKEQRSSIFRVGQTRHGALAYVTTDEFLGRSLDLCGEWAESELQLLGALLKPGDVALDVGANLGTHAVFFAQRVGPQGAVYAFGFDALQK